MIPGSKNTPQTPMFPFWRRSSRRRIPAILLMGASVQGKDLAARLSARLRAGMAQDCTAFAIEGGNLVATRPIYAGKAYAKVSFQRQPSSHGHGQAQCHGHEGA